MTDEYALQCREARLMDAVRLARELAAAPGARSTAAVAVADALVREYAHRETGGEAPSRRVIDRLVADARKNGWEAG